MKRREFERIPASLEVHSRFDSIPSLNIDYFGTATDLSEKGMFIKSQKITFPLPLQFQVTIPLRDKTLDVPVRIKRLTKSNGYYDGLGVELIHPQKEYMNIVQKLRDED